MRNTTKKCRRYDHPEICVECEDGLPNLDWLLEWIESEVAGGKRFVPQEAVQAGWSILEVHQRDDGTLGFFEPDFKSMPVQFVDSVSKTLLHLLIHKSVVESLGLDSELAIPSLRDSSVVCTDFGSTEGFLMGRVAPKSGDSGWFFGCDNPTHDHQSRDALRRVSLYEAVIRHDDRIMPFLGLPSDTFVGFGGAVPYFSRGETELVIHPGSYLHQKYVEKVSYLSDGR